MALQNMVFVEAGLHDTGLWAGQELYIAARKIQLHGFDEINAWIESLEMRTAPTLDEWINRRISMAITSYERDGDIFDREPKHPSAFLYTKWICQLRLCISNGARQEVFDAIRNGNI